ncbi:MAG TPA: EAL domain-containing protein [Solirubrobacteraceae bacterium]|nr:EAL domain-containing protein [Solirubrobacteraceae bacterium]
MRRSSPASYPGEIQAAVPSAVAGHLTELQARSLVERLPAIVYVADAGIDGRWHYVSPAAEAMLGYTPEEWLADPHLWARLVHPDDRAKVYEREARLDEPAVPEEYRMVHRDGRTVWVRDHATLLADELGRLRWHGVLSDITDRKLAEDELRSAEEDIRHQALHDALTGLPNRTLVLEHLERAGGHSGKQLAVLLLDLDRFKLVNDSFGHAAGDALLVEIAPRLREALRPGDTIGRLGGDEFVVVLADVADERVAVEVAERIVHALRRPFLLEGIEHFATVSIGIALAGSDRARPDALIRDADAALYRAKERGRGRYEVFDRAMRVQTMRRLSLENDLRRALQGQELRVRYQPIVSLRDRSLLAVEALAHWEHPRRGLIGPQEFIPVAEENGLIGPIGEWVMHESCRQAAAWHAADPDAPPLGISVNIAVRQITQRDLPGLVARTLRDTGLDSQTLHLEITETALLDDSDVADRALHALLGLGVGVVLDDFGTGYSSLAYLTRLPIAGLKIDRSFVQRLGVSERSTAIVTAIVRMAEALSIEVIAEGAETERQIEQLKRLGCHRAQGYHFAQPLDAAGVGELLTRPGRRV